MPVALSRVASSCMRVMASSRAFVERLSEVRQLHVLTRRPQCLADAAVRDVYTHVPITRP